MSGQKHEIKRALDKLKIARRRGLAAAELAENEAKGFEIAIQLFRAELIVTTRHNNFVLRQYAGSDVSPVVVDDDRRPRDDTNECHLQPDYERRIIGRVPHAREVHGPSTAQRLWQEQAALAKVAEKPRSSHSRNQSDHKPWVAVGMSRRSWYRHVYPRLKARGGASA